MAYSSIETSKVKKDLRTLKPSDYQIVPSDSPASRTNPNGYAFGHIFHRGWNNVSFPKWMQYTTFEDIFAQQPLINEIKTNLYEITKAEGADIWLGSTEILTVDVSKGYSIWNDGDVALNLMYLGYPITNNELNWTIKYTSALYSVPVSLRPDTAEGALAFNNTSQKLRSSGTGSASATTSMVVADGDAPHSGVAEKQYLKLESNTQTINESGNEVLVAKTYVICDAGQPGCVATGTVLVEGSDTGGGTIGAGSHLIGGIAVSTDLGPATYAVILNELRTAILHANGHNGSIACGGALTPADGTQSITLTQALKGTRGNTGVVNTISNVTVANFASGNYGTGPLVSRIINDGTASVWMGGSQFVGNVDLSPNRATWITMNDKPEDSDLRLFRDQGPDLINDYRFQNGRPPYSNGEIPPPSITGEDYFHPDDMWEEIEGYQMGSTLDELEWTVYVDGHWSYWNDGEPDPDYPASPGDDNYGYYRLWVEGGEWTLFQWPILVSNQSQTFDYEGFDWPDGPIYNGAFHYDVNYGQSFWMANLVDGNEYGDGLTATVFKGVNGEDIELNYDAMAVFKGSTCLGSYPAIEGEPDSLDPLTMPLMLRDYGYPEPGGEWLPYSSGDEGFVGYQTATCRITSSVVDGSNFPTDDSVFLRIENPALGGHSVYVLSDAEDFSSSPVLKINADQDRTGVLASLKNAINHANGHNGQIIATSGTGDTLILTQRDYGSHLNTEVRFGGNPELELAMSATIVISGDPDFESETPFFNFYGNFAGGGDGDGPKWVFWDAGQQKYFIMKWHHYNASTEVETMYEYWQVNEGLRNNTLPDRPYVLPTENISDSYVPMAVGSNNTNNIILYDPLLSENRWYLKAVEGEGW